MILFDAVWYKSTTNDTLYVMNGILTFLSIGYIEISKGRDCIFSDKTVNANSLIYEKSPYLIQHAYNPVHWLPWSEKAFEKATREDKPIFLSIGYSTCHWCHVMAHESFEDDTVARILNESFVSIKVDKEERPDIDSIYMAVCQAFTGSGGWPTSIFMTAEQKPFFAGTYFPPNARYGMPGFAALLRAIRKKWAENREELLDSADRALEYLNTRPKEGGGRIDGSLTREAYAQLSAAYDEQWGGFGSAPKFPTPHNLLFLMEYAKTQGEPHALAMAEHTLEQLARGGIFDHIGFGFSRYSTDRHFLVPHFEKMLYDNALLITAYARAYEQTQKQLYKAAVQKTAAYVLRELTLPEGGFACAQDADSEGVEGRFYVFDYHELLALLGEDEGRRFCARYGITPEGNFEGKNIPNLLGAKDIAADFAGEDMAAVRDILYSYRKERAALALDDKALTAWNSLMIYALAFASRMLGDENLLGAAERAESFIARRLTDGDTLYVSWREGTRSGKGFLDDYAFYALALLGLYDATLEPRCLTRALAICRKAIMDFWDDEHGGFTLSGRENEALIIAPKDTYDGAIPSGNAVIAYCLVRLCRLAPDAGLEKFTQRHLAFLCGSAKEYPAGHCFFLLALSRYDNPPTEITAVLRDPADLVRLAGKTKPDAEVRVLLHPAEGFALIHDKTTFYICRGRHCLPPTNDWTEVLQ